MVTTQITTCGELTSFPGKRADVTSLSHLVIWVTYGGGYLLQTCDWRAYSPNLSGVGVARTYYRPSLWYCQAAPDHQSLHPPPPAAAGNRALSVTGAASLPGDHNIYSFE